MCFAANLLYFRIYSWPEVCSHVWRPIGRNMWRAAAPAERHFSVYLWTRIQLLLLLRLRVRLEAAPAPANTAAAVERPAPARRVAALTRPLPGPRRPQRACAQKGLRPRRLAASHEPYRSDSGPSLTQSALFSSDHSTHEWHKLNCSFVLKFLGYYC